MFNQELKERFSLQYSTNANIRRQCYLLFNTTEKYELVWGSDICTQPVDVLQPIMGEILGMRSVSIQSRKRILNKYALWCIREGVPGACDGLIAVSYNVSDKLRTRMVRNPMHLQMYLDTFCDPESEETVDNIIRCFVWLAYAGFHEDDCAKLTVDNVDFVNMVVRFEREDYPIYREAIPAFRNCVFLKKFKLVHPLYTKTGETYKDRTDNKLLLRSIKGTLDKNSLMIAYSKIRLRAQRSGNDMLGLTVPYRNVWLSGQFYRAYQLEIAGVKPNFMATAEAAMKKKEYKLTKTNTESVIRNTLMDDYLEDYLRWKETLKV